MIRVIGVRFRNVGKVYYFSPQDFDIYTGDHVIVETARGIEYGTVVLAPRDVEDDKVVQPLKDVLRVATPEDDEQEAYNRQREKEAFNICLEKIRTHGLEMKLIDAEYTFDNNKVLFYFTADGRIDFRELVKDLAAIFKTRIELRQIGVRDETKILGGIGICGRALCCHTYLSEFAPVSIKMAKEQNLSLNPTKISGTCGRLMCCLKNEQETYEYLNSRLPSVGDYAVTPDGLKGEVQSVNVLRQLVKVLVQVDKDEVDLQEFKVDELVIHSKGKKERDKKEPGAMGEMAVDELPEEVAELELLEEKEMTDNKPAQRSQEKKGFDKKSGERKYQERKHFDKKTNEKKYQDKKIQEKEWVNKDLQEQESLEQVPSEKQEVVLEDKAAQEITAPEKGRQDKRRPEKKNFDKKFQDRKYQDRRSQERNHEKVHDKPFEKEKKYKKHKDRGREKQHDSNVTSE